MIDSMLCGFLMAKKHCRRGADAHLMRCAMDVKPLFAGFLASTNLAANGWFEYFRSASGETTQTGVSQLIEDGFNGYFSHPGQMHDLDGSKGFDRESWTGRADGFENVQINGEFPSGMQPANHVDFPGTCVGRLLRSPGNFIDAQFVSLGVAFPFGKSAEIAVQYADI